MPPKNHEELMNKAFGSGNWQLDKQLAGFSGASVYQVIYRDRPVVVKIAHPVIIKRERDCYHEFVLDDLHHHTPKLGEYFESDDQQHALIRYTYAGNVARSQTLFEFLAGPEGNKPVTPQAVKEACMILERMFATTASDHPKSWWERGQRSNIRCTDYYDRWLPVQLELEYLPTPVAGAKLLQADKFSLEEQAIAQWSPGDFVQLQGFLVEKAEANVITLYIGRPQAPTLRIKVRGIQGSQQGELPPFYAVVRKTRKMLLERYAEEAVGAFGMSSPHFTVDKRTYDNPFYYLEKLLEVRENAYVATIHGDFNLRNIQIEEKTAQAPNWWRAYWQRLFGRKTYDWWLIDFASVQPGPILLDLQWLEAQVINWLLTPALQRSGQGPDALADVMDGLHRRSALYFRLRTSELRAIYTLLQTIRRLAEHYLVKAPHDSARWQEYYRGLTLALATTLKHEALNNEVKKFALVAAGKTIRWAREKDLPPPRWLLFLGPVLAFVVVAAILVYGYPRLFAPGTPTPTVVLPTPSATPAPPATATAPPPTATQPAVTPATPLLPPSTLARVRERTYLLCGVNGNLPLFSWDPASPKHENWDPAKPTVLDSYDNAEGFDADFCRVVAFAVFGEQAKVKFVNLGAGERFQAVATGVVDLLSRNTTWTPDRDNGLGVDFAAINFYTKQGLIVPKKSGFDSWMALAGKRICVLPTTTTYANLVALQPQMGWSPVISNDNARDGFQNTRQAVEALKAENYCEAFSSDIAQLTAFNRTPLANDGMTYLSPEEYEILPIDDPAIPDEPQTIVVAEHDNQWRQIVSYAVWATIYAEELGVTQGNVGSFDENAALRFKEFLGLPDPLIPVNGQIGERLGLSPTFASAIIAHLGNYGEIYNKHLAAYFPERGPNQSGKLSPHGRLFTPPFVLAQLASPIPTQVMTTTPALGPTRVPITIGVAIDRDGSELLLGDDQNNAALLAGAIFSRTIPGVQIVVKVVNAGNTVAKATTAMHRLINDYQVVAISGPTLSSQAIKVDQIPNEAGVPIIAPSNTVPGIPELGCYVARVSPPVNQIDPLALTGAAEKLPRGGKVVVAYRNDNEFTIAEAAVFTETLAARDSDYRFALQATVAYTKTADFAEKAAQINRYQPDLVIIAGLPKDGGTLVFQLRQQEYKGIIIGGNGFNTSGIFDVCDDCSKIILAQAFDSRERNPDTMHHKFMTHYQQRYQEPPSPIAAQMFSALQVVVEALAELNQHAQITPATPLSTLRDGINRRLLSGRPFTDTPIGAIAFTPTGEILQPEFYVAETAQDAQGQWRFKTLDNRENEALASLDTLSSDCPAGYLPPSTKKAQEQ